MDDLSVELKIDTRYNKVDVRHEGEEIILKMSEATVKRIYVHLNRVVLPNLKAYKKEMKKK